MVVHIATLLSRKTVTSSCGQGDTLYYQEIGLGMRKDVKPPKALYYRVDTLKKRTIEALCKWNLEKIPRIFSIITSFWR